MKDNNIRVLKIDLLLAQNRLNIMTEYNRAVGTMTMLSGSIISLCWNIARGAIIIVAVEWDTPRLATITWSLMIPLLWLFFTYYTKARLLRKHLSEDICN